MRISLDPSSVADYDTFLKVKRLPKYNVVGRTVEFPDEYAGQLGIKQRKRKAAAYAPSEWLFDYQRDIAAMAITKKRYSVFADCGLGKTAILTEFARYIFQSKKRPRVLIVSPLMVVAQTVAEGRGEDDTKHICPLQLEVIRRLVRLYSSPGEVVFSPFTGIGSEGYVSLSLFRKFYGCELKAEYHAAAIRNLDRAIRSRKVEAEQVLFPAGAA